MATSNWMANKAVDWLRHEGDIPVTQLKKRLQRKYGLDNMPYHRVWRGKCKGNNMIWESYDDLYALVPAQRYELLKRNPNSIEEVSNEEHSYLLSEKDHCWSRSLFGTTVKCCHLTNNVVESFNAFLGDARAKPIIYCVDVIRVKFMSMMNKRRMIAERWNGVLVPEAHKQLIELSKNKGMYDVQRSSIDMAEVDGP
ncbi:hypothetical protein QJS10_CPB13g01498 [Acorus calamus]|uniref:Uncharacterized protein n=1 Tax=Acorus calamus TaxID=4465 RepID=A0AAV9DHN9_ACOCL|nr:hypothetical protein QJS10_CPB13g01498 [Acorus calamus]